MDYRQRPLKLQGMLRLATELHSADELVLTGLLFDVTCNHWADLGSVQRSVTLIMQQTLLSCKA